MIRSYKSKFLFVLIDNSVQPVGQQLSNNLYRDFVKLLYPYGDLRSTLDVGYCRCSNRCRVSARFFRFTGFLDVSSKSLRCSCSY